MSDVSMKNKFETAADSTWSAWYDYAPTGTANGHGSPGTAAAGVHHDGRMEVFAVTPTGGIENKYEQAADGPWSTWFGFGPGGTADAVTTVEHSDGRMEVFAVMSDGSIQNKYETSADGPWSAWFGYAPAGTAHG